MYETMWLHETAADSFCGHVCKLLWYWPELRLPRAVMVHGGIGPCHVRLHAADAIALRPSQHVCVTGLKFRSAMQSVVLTRLALL